MQEAASSYVACRGRKKKAVSGIVVMRMHIQAEKQKEIQRKQEVS